MNLINLSLLSCFVFVNFICFSQANKYQKNYSENFYFYSYVNQNQFEKTLINNNEKLCLKTKNYPKLNYAFDYKWLSISYSTPIKMFSKFETIGTDISYGVNFNNLRFSGKYEKNNYSNKSSSNKYELALNFIKNNAIVNYGSCFFFTKKQTRTAHSSLARVSYSNINFTSLEYQNNNYSNIGLSLGFIGCVNLNKGFFVSYESLVNISNSLQGNVGYSFKSMLGYSNQNIFLGFYTKLEQEQSISLIEKNNYWMFIWGVRF